MNSQAWFHRIKAAQRDLIRMAGGIERAAEITSVSSSHIGRMNNARDTDLMPISVVIALEEECGIPIITSAMAELNGRRLSDPAAERAAEQTVLSSYGDVARKSGDLLSGGAIAFSDGSVSPAEAHKMDRDAADLELELSRFRQALALVKARGGEKAALRVVGEGE